MINEYAWFEVLAQHLPGRTFRKTSKTLVTITDLPPRFEPVTSRIRSSSASHSTITFSKLSWSS
jgi:hypothetical protein